MFNWEQKKARSGQRTGNRSSASCRPGLSLGRLERFDGLLRIRRTASSTSKPGVFEAISQLLAFGHGARRGGDPHYNWDNAIIERGDSRRGLPWNSNQAGSLTASTQSRTMFCRCDRHEGEAARYCGPDAWRRRCDYDPVTRKSSKADASKSIT